MIVSIEISQSTTSPLNEEEVNDLESLVAQAYGVDTDEVTSVTEYVTAGTMVVDIPETISEEEALNELTNALASSLGVSEDRITLSLDPESGEVTYSVTTTDYDNTASVLDALQSPDLIDDIVTNTDVVSISDIIPSADIVAEVDVIVNGDEVDVPLQIAENTIDALLGDDYDTRMEVNFVTSAPTQTPSFVPTMAPTSTVPTMAPTITGSVVFVEMNKIVTASLSEEDVAEIVASAETTFNVYPGSVEAEISYDITGTVAITTDGTDLSEESVASALQTSIADTLNVHPSDVDVVIDSDSGVATYTISSATADEAAVLQDELQLATTSDAIASEVANVLPAISSVTRYLIFPYEFNFELIVDPEYGVYAEVTLTVDATNADDVDSSIAAFEVSAGDDWSVDAQAVFVSSAPTEAPSTIPTALPSTLQPSSQPSITGLVVTIDVS